MEREEGSAIQQRDLFGDGEDCKEKRIQGRERFRKISWGIDAERVLTLNVVKVRLINFKSHL